MQCLVCDSDKLTFDSTTGMYYCEKCKKLYTFEIDEDEPIEEEVEIGTPNGFISIVLHILQTIPVIGLFIPFLVDRPNIEQSYKKQFGYRFIAQVIITVLLMLGILAIIFLDRQDYYINSVKNMSHILDRLENGYISHNDIDIQYPSKNALEDIISKHINTTYKEDINENQFAYFDNTMISGEKVYNLLEYASDSRLALLLQTDSIRRKFGNDIYRNYGYLINTGSQDSFVSNVYVKLNGRVNSLYRTEDDELVKLELKDLDDIKFISYIDPDSQFLFKVIYNDDYNVIALTFVEEEKMTEEELENEQ